MRSTLAQLEEQCSLGLHSLVGIENLPWEQLKLRRAHSPCDARLLELAGGRRLHRELALRRRVQRTLWAVATVTGLPSCATRTAAASLGPALVVGAGDQLGGVHQWARLDSAARKADELRIGAQQRHGRRIHCFLKRLDRVSTPTAVDEPRGSWVDRLLGNNPSLHSCCVNLVVHRRRRRADGERGSLHHRGC